MGSEAIEHRITEGFSTISHRADLAVIGGGPAGICAAIAAAREGLEVVLMQDRPVLGGNASSEIRMWICGANGTHNRATGIIEDLELENLYRNPTKNYYLWDTVLLEAVKAQPGITLLLNCSCMAAEMRSPACIASVTGWQATTQTFHRVEATYFADCSGDSVLAPLTGAEFRMGREASSEFDEGTSVSCADTKTMGNSCLLQIRRGTHPCPFVPPPGITHVTDEMAHDRFPDIFSPWENFWSLELGGEDNCIRDAERLRDKLLMLALGVWDYIKNSGRIPGAETLELAFLGFLPGKRESRRMMGPHLVTKGEIMAGGRFGDTVAFGGWNVDDHDPAGFYKKGVMNTHEPTPSPYGIPLSCLYSRNVDNLFFAGRNISMTHAAMSSARVMATCALVGEAVGTAAAECASDRSRPADLSAAQIAHIQQTLMRRGCFLPGVERQVSSLTRQTPLEGPLPQAELDTLRNGRDRDHPLYGPAEQGCYLPLGQAVTYVFPAPTRVEEARLSFDSDLDRVTLPGNACERTHGMRANEWPDSPLSCMPKTLVRSFRVEGLDPAGKPVFVHEETDCRRATLLLPIGATVSSLSFVPASTWDESAELAHVYGFEII